MISAGITVNFPKWVIMVTDSASGVTNTGLQYRDKRYAQCLYVSGYVICRVGDMHAVLPNFAGGPGRPTGLGQNTSIPPW